MVLPAIGAEESVTGATTSSDVDQAKLEPDLLEAARKAGLPRVMLTSGGISEAELREAGADEVYAGPGQPARQVRRVAARSYAPRELTRVGRADAADRGGWIVTTALCTSFYAGRCQKTGLPPVTPSTVPET
ncbi:MAG: hypothetical protein ACRDPJ_01925 [Nocardioidaceae bacterium]